MDGYAEAQRKKEGFLDYQIDLKLAERERFELSKGVNPYTRSRRAPSTTRPPLRVLEH